MTARSTPAGATIADVLREIAAGYARGTPNGIRMDPASGLIWSPAHFTWMDTNYPACTPREGYPVEIQALVDPPVAPSRAPGRQPPARTVARPGGSRGGILKKLFWLEEPGYLADLLIARPGQPAAGAVPDNALRSNYLFAVAFGLFAGAPARRAVSAAACVICWCRARSAPWLRCPSRRRWQSAAPTAGFWAIPREPYWGRYEGDEDTRRKPAYHNGTAWIWTLPVGLRGAGAGLGFLARRCRRRQSLSRRHGPSDDRRLPGPDAGNPGRRRASSTARLRRPGLERLTEALRVWKWLNSI